MKRVKQFRYYGESNIDKKNTPGTTAYVLHYGNIFKDCGVISHLGIQAKPGTQFRLNGNSSLIHVGMTGIYELDLGNLGVIKSIQFELDSLNDPDITSYGLIIDIIYEGM